MFERRLKIFLGILIGITLILLVRAAHLQLANGEYWRKQASETLRRRTLVEPVRGNIIDFKENLLATDVACIDAAVDFRAIDEDPKWIKEQATSRLVAKMGSDYRRTEKKAREKLLEDEIKHVEADIANLWKVLAQVSGKNLEEIETIKNHIRLRIDMRQRSLWTRKYQAAVKAEDERNALPWYKDWRLGGKSNPDIDKFNVPVSEQTEAHVIVHNISNEVNNQLAKRLEQFPGLVLRPSKHRIYPYGEVACHIIGHMGPVEPDDLDYAKNNELVQYFPNDKIGRTGVESMCELTLRGQRGRIEWVLGHEGAPSRQEALQGKTVKLTIDINLQADIENAFKHVTWRDPNTRAITEEHEMHGAAIVIDVATGEVRALVSYPTYDLNKLDELYAALSRDDSNKPLLNRATQGQYEPGSTVKPIVGAGAITQHVIDVDGKVECTGFLVIDGRPLISGRCWTASKQMQRDYPTTFAHHGAGREPHPTGWLTVTDAIQRSCNVYFENMGDHLGIEGLAYWFSQFGLGRKTEIGLPESTGLLPHIVEKSPLYLMRSTSWFASIGQGQILVTPLQMANVAATIARNGTWVRPRLVTNMKDLSRPTTRSALPQSPERYTLPIASETFAAIQEGMFRAVASDAGSAAAMRRPDIPICGKTGTAQAHRFSYYKRDDDGNLLYENGSKVRELPAMNIPGVSQNPQLPWYRGVAGEAPHHGWFIGYAPRNNPKVAFAIMIEYGGNGGHDAAPISNAVIDACVKHRYLVP